MSNEKQQPIGAMWAKQTKAGKTFYTGTIEVKGEKIKIKMFNNDFKKDKQPDIKIYVDDYVPGQQVSSQPEPKDDLPF